MEEDAGPIILTCQKMDRSLKEFAAEACAESLLTSVRLSTETALSFRCAKTNRPFKNKKIIRTNTAEMASMFELKTIKFLGRVVSILLQNENGPCPLLAMCNCLLLRGQIVLHSDSGQVSFEHVVALIVERLFQYPSNAEIAATLERQLDDTIGLLGLLQHGLDVNGTQCSRDWISIKLTPNPTVYFGPAQLGSKTAQPANPCTGFEYTKAFAPFDLLDIDIVYVHSPSR